MCHKIMLNQAALASLANRHIESQWSNGFSESIVHRLAQEAEVSEGGSPEKHHQLRNARCQHWSQQSPKLPINFRNISLTVCNMDLHA